MSDYPAGAEFDSSAPYNTIEQNNECKECRCNLNEGDYCEPCSDYLAREKQKRNAINKCQQLKNMFETSTHNTYAVNKLSEIINEINKI